MVSLVCLAAFIKITSKQKTISQISRGWENILWNLTLDWTIAGITFPPLAPFRFVWFQNAAAIVPTQMKFLIRQSKSNFITTMLLCNFSHDFLSSLQSCYLTPAIDIPISLFRHLAFDRFEKRKNAVFLASHFYRSAEPIYKNNK